MKNPNRLRLERNDKMKLNFNFSGKTLLKDWWKTVRDNFTTIQTDHNTLSDKLDTEITQRTNADVGLSDQITAEKRRGKVPTIRYKGILTQRRKTGGSVTVNCENKF